MKLRRRAAVPAGNATAVLDAVNGLMTSADFVDIEDIDFTSGQTLRLTHKLGRPFKGWNVIRINAVGVLYEDTTKSPDKSVEIYLKASAALTATVRVF